MLEIPSRRRCNNVKEKQGLRSLGFNTEHTFATNSPFSSKDGCLQRVTGVSVLHQPSLGGKGPIEDIDVGSCLCNDGCVLYLRGVNKDGCCT
jgi:hypothetical protein